MTEFKCSCGYSLNTELIQVDKKEDCVAAYVECPECEAISYLMFDTKDSEKIKDKITKAKEILLYLQTELFLEMSKAEDKYMSQKYEELSDEEKVLVGPYVSKVSKEQERKYKELISKDKYNIKDLMRLL